MENSSWRQFSRTLSVILFGVLVFAGATQAQVVSRSKEIVVVTPTSLPTLAQEPGIAFQLYSEAGDGSAYLYIEQNQGERLLVLDVTDPAHVKMVGAVTLTVPGPFEFVRTIGSSAFLISFRNNLGGAVLDLRKPKAPTLKAVPNLHDVGRSEPIGDSAFLIPDGGNMDRLAAPRDYQVLDTSNPADPSLLFTVKQVTSKLERNETGTTFLLGHDGLTIIRRPQVEYRYKSEQGYGT